MNCRIARNRRCALPNFGEWLIVLAHPAVFDITEADGSKVESPRKLEALAQVSDFIFPDAELPFVDGAFPAVHLRVHIAKTLIVASCTVQMLSAEDGSNALIGDLLPGLVNSFHACSLHPADIRLLITAQKRLLGLTACALCR